jgi:hypothetical protein
MNNRLAASTCNKIRALPYSCSLYFHTRALRSELTEETESETKPLIRVRAFALLTKE